LTKRSALGGGSLLALAAIFIGLTIVFSHLLTGWRLDLTQNKLYSTAPGTAKILASLKEPIDVYFFFSDKAAAASPALKTYGTRVREFLQELATRSNGKLRLQIIDPEPFSEEEDRASELGVRAMPAGNAGGPPLYFGLAATNSTDGRASIEFFDPNKEEFLEYDVVKLIYQLANPRKPVIGWLSGIPMTPAYDPQTGQPQGNAPVIYTQAQQLFNVRDLTAATLAAKDLADLTVLVLIHPKELPPAAQFAIDQFALRGGHIVAFVDPIAEQDPAAKSQQQLMAQGQMMEGGADKSSHLEPLLSAWGVEFNPNQVVGDQELALQVGMQPGMPPVRHLGILGLRQDNFDRKDVVTAGLSNVNVATAGFLRARKGSGIKFEPLLQTSTGAAPMAKERFGMMSDPASLLDGFKPTGERYAIAARVTGNVKTAFPGGAPAGVTLPAGTRPLASSAKPLNLIVVADTDILSDFLWVRVQNFFGSPVAQPFAHNGDFLFNSLDNLTGSEDLISVRGRATFTRPFVVVDKLRADAESRFHAKEQELENQLSETEQKLTQLEARRNDQSSSLIMTPEQERALDRFQDEKVRIRKELRGVRLGLDQDIRRLGNKLQIINIVAAPLSFTLLALGFVAWRRRRRKAAASGGCI
jgi:ABC-type uncharacterized transport system involved in gliding motility auxiliary subunit